MTNKELSKRDLAHIWHPCSQMSDHDNFDIVPIKFGRGAVVADFDGNEYIDCVSSWWVNLFGHANSYISAKLAEQATKLEQVILAGFSHEGIIRLCERLTDILPSPLNKCFFGDNGSSAIEIALKMSYHKNLLKGENKPLFLNLKNSYHGETIGALSVGDVEIYKKTYNDILIKTIQCAVPMNFQDRKVSEDEALSDLKRVLDERAHEISAFILEPLIQCSGDMNMISASYVKKACELVRSYGVDIIFDEIAVGFGRTGTMFALEQCDIVPDFICLSKGLTGGYMPFSMVVTSDAVYDAFLGGLDRAFLHSHSYTGNALACACANATLDIFEQENVIERNKDLSRFIYSEFTQLKRFDFVDNFRQTGMITAFDLTGFSNPRIGYEIYKRALSKGLLLRPLAHTVYFMPPYVISNEQVEFVAKAIGEILEDLAKIRK